MMKLLRAGARPVGDVVRFRPRRNEAGQRQPTSWKRRLRTIGNLVFIAVIVVIALNQGGGFDLGAGGYKAVDGDSLRRGETEIRLHGIDAVELNQTCRDAQGADYACGRKAADSLRDLMRGHAITCKAIERDRYEREVAVCSDGAFDLNREQVRAGWALAYTRHSLRYVAAEREARNAKRGIWAGRFEEPEAYRESHRRVEGDALAGD
jgi:endonuclease YncB( thermonuclease family)